MRSGIILGSFFTDCQLPDLRGTLRRPSELQGENPLIRGGKP
jgi:hypothetical protein